jgi:ATP-dependent DNA helicase DinG
VSRKKRRVEPEPPEAAGPSAVDPEVAWATGEAPGEIDPMLGDPTALFDPTLDDPFAVSPDAEERHGIPVEELAPAVEAFFAPGGPLARVVSGYEDRPEQLVVALAVARALRGSHKLFAEAGTGTGKTLAYLVPLVLSGRRVVVSTATKTLQDQIMEVDVPLLGLALGRKVEARLMKGRSNYLCLTRAGKVLSQRHLDGVDDEALLPQVMAWAERTSTGDRAELEALPDGSSLWRELSATSEQCTGRACTSFERCFVTQMRRRAASADVVVANHHLYFADVSLRGRVRDPSVALLPAHELAVFDEAHELEEVAAQHFGAEVGEGRLYELGRDLGRLATGDASLATSVRRLAEELEVRTRLLFGALPFDGGRRALRPAELGEETWSHWRALDHHLRQIAAAVEPLAVEEAPAIARRATGLASELRFALGVSPDGEPPTRVERHDDSWEYAQPTPDEEQHGTAEAVAALDFVRYTETFGRARAVVVRPVDVAPIVGRELSPRPAIFASATLTVGGDFGFLRRRLGIEDAEELVVDSPFDYSRQASLYLPDDLPGPEADDFPEAAAARAAALVAAAGGGAFVLCTSHRMLTVVRRTVGATGVLTLTQGDAPKARLLEQFKAAGNAALCATLSFWQGVDVPGRALRLVVIDKLPFASPGDPLLAARLERLKAHGQDPFESYQLPQAALLLRQGFGRLIRRRTDRGMVALLDRRIVTRRYGQTLLSSLPPCRRLTSLDEALAELGTLSSSS